MEWEIMQDFIKPTGKFINLLTLYEFQKLSDDTKLISIEGTMSLKKDADDDTRGGYVAYGLATSLHTKE